MVLGIVNVLVLILLVVGVVVLVVLVVVPVVVFLVVALVVVLLLLLLLVVLLVVVVVVGGGIGVLSSPSPLPLPLPLSTVSGMRPPRVPMLRRCREKRSSKKVMRVSWKHVVRGARSSSLSNVSVLGRVPGRTNAFRFMAPSCAVSCVYSVWFVGL